jgi:hypothetical protein
MQAYDGAGVSSIKRYSQDSDYRLYESEDGELVMYADHEAEVGKVYDEFHGFAPCGHEWKFTDRRGDEFHECFECTREQYANLITSLRAKVMALESELKQLHEVFAQSIEARSKGL